MEHRDVARELTTLCVQAVLLSDDETKNHTQLVKSAGETYDMIMELLVNHNRNLEVPSFQRESAVAITKAIANRIDLYEGRQALGTKLEYIATKVTDIYFKLLADLEGAPIG